MACSDSLHFPTSLEMYVTCCVKFDTEMENSVFAAPRRPHISLVTETSYEVCVCVCVCVYTRAVRGVKTLKTREPAGGGGRGGGGGGGRGVERTVRKKRPRT